MKFDDFEQRPLLRDVHINKDVVYLILSKGREDIQRIISKIANNFL